MFLARKRWWFAALLTMALSGAFFYRSAVVRMGTAAEFRRPIEPFQRLDARRSTKAERTLLWLDLWNNDPNCTKFDVSLLEEASVEPGALVSFPGSGNSWLRMLLMGVTGVYINSIYGGQDGQFESRANRTYPLDSDCHCTLIQKTHDFTLDAHLYSLAQTNRTHSLERFHNKGVLIIRNPFEAIVAYRNFGAGGMKGVASKEEFQGPGWDGFVARSIASWELLATTWIRGLKRGGVVFYEELSHNTEAELVRIGQLLGVPTIDNERLQCVLRHTKSTSFKRKKDKTKFPSNVFSETQTLLIVKSIEHVQAVLKERRLDPLPVAKYQFYEPIQYYGIPSP